MMGEGHGGVEASNFYEDCVNHKEGKVIFQWREINKYGLPNKQYHEYYKDRYSVPVIAANKDTGQVFLGVMYDFFDKGWCKCGLNDGASCKNYEIPYITHYGYIPVFPYEMQSPTWFSVDEEADRRIEEYFASKPIKTKIIFENYRIKSLDSNDDGI